MTYSGFLGLKKGVSCQLHRAYASRASSGDRRKGIASAPGGTVNGSGVASSGGFEKLNRSVIQLQVEKSAEGINVKETDGEDTDLEVELPTGFEILNRWGTLEMDGSIGVMMTE